MHSKGTLNQADLSEVVSKRAYKPRSGETPYKSVNGKNEPRVLACTTLRLIKSRLQRFRSRQALLSPVRTILETGNETDLICNDWRTSTGNHQCGSMLMRAKIHLAKMRREKNERLNHDFRRWLVGNTAIKKLRSPSILLMYSTSASMPIRFRRLTLVCIAPPNAFDRNATLSILIFGNYGQSVLQTYIATMIC